MGIKSTEDQIKSYIIYKTRIIEMLSSIYTWKMDLNSFMRMKRVSNIDIMCRQTKSLVPRTWNTSVFYSVSIKTELILPDWFSHMAHFFSSIS